MKCKGHSDFCGKRCPECSRFADDCEGNPDWDYVDGTWVNVSELKEEEKPC